MDTDSFSQSPKSHIQTASADHGPKPGHYLLLTAVLGSAALVYLLGNDRIALWDRDEPRFAQASREMIERQDFIVPHFNGAYRFDKPVLIYWLMTANYRLFGINEFTARLGSSLSGVLACWLMYLLGRKFFNRQVGLFAAAILASCPLMVVESKLATADALLTVFLVAVLGLWLAIQGTRTKWYYAVLLGLALGLGTLAKGPIVWLFLGAGALASALLQMGRKILRDNSYQRLAKPPDKTWGLTIRNVALLLLAVAVAAAVFLPWGLAALVKTQGAYWSEGVGRHVLQRSSESLEGHWGPPGYYLASWIVCAFPWSVLGPLAIWQAWRSRKDDWRMAGLLGWVIGPWLVLELVQTKLVHYALGCYPAMAILIAVLLYDWQDELGQKLKSSVLGRMALSALWIIAIAIGAALVTAVGFLCLGPLAQLGGPGAPLLLAAGLAGLVTVGTGLLVRHSLVKGRTKAAIACGFTGVMIWAAIVGGLVAPAISSYRVAPKAAAVAKKLSPPGTQFVLFGFDEPSMIWYLAADKPVQIAGTSKELIRAYEKNEPICVIVSKTKMDKLKASGFTPPDVGQWVDGLYLGKWRETEKIELWVGLNKAALDKK